MEGDGTCHISLDLFGLYFLIYLSIYLNCDYLADGLDGLFSFYPYTSLSLFIDTNTNSTEKSKDKVFNKYC